MIQITGGLWKGRSLKTPGISRSGQEVTRPTQARLRQAWMNALQTSIPNSRVLEVFAGSGALGLECLSRGADSVVWVEKDFLVAKCLRENLKLFDVSAPSLVFNDDLFGRRLRSALDSYVEENGPFQLVFADPPYDHNFELKLLNELPWQRWLASDGKIGIESSRQTELPVETQSEGKKLTQIRQKDYGDSVLTFYAWLHDS